MSASFVGFFELSVVGISHVTHTQCCLRRDLRDGDGNHHNNQTEVGTMTHNKAY